MVKIEWAPLMIPPRRRLQTFTVGVFIFCLNVLGLISYPICAWIFLFGSVYLKVPVFVYTLWIWCERDRAENCVRGEGVRWMRDNSFWRHFRDYFPVELVKTAELPPNKNYLLACYPHGVICFGLFTNMCFDIRKWNELFPKVRVHLATLTSSFSAPIWRHIIQSWSMISVTRRSLINNLSTSNDPQDPVNADGYTATAVGIAVGGSREAVDARPGHHLITIRNRKGFIKIAMQTGAALVPVFSFGELDTYDQIANSPGSFVRKVQTLVLDITGIPAVFVKGRGFFQYTFGLLPHRRRIVQVVGAPIDVTQTENPTEEEVDELHKKFMDCLQELFETHKSKYIENSEEAVLVMQ